MADELPESVRIALALGVDLEADIGADGVGVETSTMFAERIARLAIEESARELRERLERAQAALLDEIEQFLEDHEDVLDGADGPRPNMAMTLLRELRESRAVAIREAKE